MDFEKMRRQFEALPPEAQRQVANFIAFLYARSQRSRLPKRSGKSKLAEEPFVGLWEDRNERELRVLERFLRRFSIVTINEAIAATGLSLLRQYRLSHALLIADALIAATALTSASPLVTKNQRDYRFIAGLELLLYPPAVV